MENLEIEDLPEGSEEIMAWTRRVRVWLRLGTDRLTEYITLPRKAMREGHPGYKPPRMGVNGTYEPPEYAICILGPDIVLGQGFATSPRDIGSVIMPENSCVVLEEVHAYVLESSDYKHAWVTDTITFFQNHCDVIFLPN